MKPKANRTKVIKEYKSPYPDPIIFQKGEEVTVGREYKEDPDWKDWIWCQGNNNNSAWVPKQYIDMDDVKGVFTRDYNAMELSVQAGEELVVYETINGFGMSENSNGERGWVPLKNMELRNNE